MLRTTITQCRQIALFALGVSLLTACGNSQSGMKLGDSEYAVSVSYTHLTLPTIA